MMEFRISTSVGFTNVTLSGLSMLGPYYCNKKEFEKEVVRYLKEQGYKVAEPELELKPCPYCKSRDIDLDYDNYNAEKDKYESWLRCNICGLSSPIGLSGKQARRLWNALPRKERG